MLEESLELREDLVRADLLPPLLKIAIQRIAALPSSACSSLSPVERAAVAHLVRCTNAGNVRTPIRIRKALLAANIGISVRSTYRVLKSLENRGLILRPTQAISRAEGAQISHILWSTLSIESLFSSPSQVSKNQTKASSLTVQTSPSIQAPVLGLGGSTANLAHACKNSQFIKRQSLEFSANSVPSDLQVLETVIEKRLIFKVMGIFTRAGKRLSDVITGRIEPILKSRKPYAYLLSLINAPVIKAHRPMSLPQTAKTAVQPRKLEPHSKLPINFRIQIDGALFQRNNNLVEVYRGIARIGSMSLSKFYSLHGEAFLGIAGLGPLT